MFILWKNISSSIIGSFIVINNCVRNKFRTWGTKARKWTIKITVIRHRRKTDWKTNRKPTEKPTEKSEEQKTSDTQPNSDSTYELTAGNYEVPADIPAGKYDIVAVSGHGVFTINNTDGYADLSEFLGVDNDEYAIKEYKNAKILEGNTIEISSTLKAKLVPKD